MPVVSKEDTFPPMKRGQMNIFKPTQIKAMGGVEKLWDAMEQKGEIQTPQLDFTEEQWKEMEQLLIED